MIEFIVQTCEPIEPTKFDLTAVERLALGIDSHAKALGDMLAGIGPGSTDGSGAVRRLTYADLMTDKALELVARSGRSPSSSQNSHTVVRTVLLWDNLPQVLPRPPAQ